MTDEQLCKLAEMIGLRAEWQRTQPAKLVSFIAYDNDGRPSVWIDAEEFRAMVEMAKGIS